MIRSSVLEDLQYVVLEFEDDHYGRVRLERCWLIEPGVRFRKECLGWTLPRFQRAEYGDTWSYLAVLAHWILFLARPIVQDTPLPWQKPQTRLTPQRVRQSLKPMVRQAHHMFSC